MDKEIKGGPDPANDESRPRALTLVMREEADAILSTSLFRRSPVIARLLQFLLQETLADRSAQLKSYIVAVDGLGRSSDHEVGDSYARVQMGRLRKMLQSHYSEHGPVEELCLYLQPGSYTLRAGPLATAYPTLYRPLSATQPNTPSQANGAAMHMPSGANTAITSLPMDVTNIAKWWVFLGMTVAIVALLAVLLTWQTNQKALENTMSPVLELMPVEADSGQNMASVSRIVSTTLIDGLPRFKLARVRVMQPNAAIENIKTKDRIYQLNTQIVHDGLTNKILVRLTEADTKLTIWSRDISIPLEPEKVAGTLGPLLAEINGPFGVIATRGEIQFKDVNSGGYACLIKYFGFLKTRDRDLETQLAACLKKPVEETRLRSTILAARAFFALESKSGQNNSSALIEARKFARLAVAADPDDGAARYAMARLAYFTGDCVSARFYTQQAVEANPNSPIILANLASLAPQCSYKYADKLLDQAFLIQREGDANGRLLLVMASLSQGRADKVAELEKMNVSRSGNQRVSYYLTETLIAASQNRDRDAARNWKLFSNALPEQMTTPDQKLQHIILSPAVRRRLVKFLGEKKVFGGT